MHVSSRTIADLFAGPHDTLASCLGGSRDTACFTASSEVTASAPAASPFADCLRAEGGAGCFAAARLKALAAELTAPVAPSGLTANVSATTVTLIWTAPAAGDPAVSYLIEAGSAPGLSNLASLSTGNVATSFSAGGIPVGTYYVRVRAANAAGSSPPSNEVVLQVGGPVGCGPLGTPALSVVTNTGGTVGFSWTIPSGGPTAYILQAGSAPGLANLANLDLRQASPTFSTSGVPAGIYYVRVLARRNDCALSAPSNEVIVNVGPPLGQQARISFIAQANPCGEVFPFFGIINGTRGTSFTLAPGSYSYVACSTFRTSSSDVDVCGPIHAVHARAWRPQTCSIW